MLTLEGKSFTPNGVLVAMVTPMKEDESLNVHELKKQVHRFVHAEVDSLFCLGTNGEFYALSYDEKLQVIDTVVQEAAGACPVCAGVGCVTTAETERLAGAAERYGADAVSVIAPYFTALSQEQLARHFRSVAESTSLPVILYNIPARTGNSISPKILPQLAEISNIVAVKDSSGRLETIRAFLHEVKGRMAILAGTDSLILSALEEGASGTVSGLANIVPELVVKIYRSWKNGHMEQARAAQERLVCVRRIIALGNPNSLTKRAVNLIGQTVGPVREPARVASSDVDRRIIEILEECGLHTVQPVKDDSQQDS